MTPPLPQASWPVQNAPLQNPTDSPQGRCHILDFPLGKGIFFHIKQHFQAQVQHIGQFRRRSVCIFKQVQKYSLAFNHGSNVIN